MKLQFEVDGRIEDLMNDEKRLMGLAVTASVQGAARSLKALIRQQVEGAGLGGKVSNSVQLKNYPETGFSYEPASFVYAKADKIVEAFDRGGIIRSKYGFWLAIPTDEVPRAKGGKKLTPYQWEQRTGRPLQFVKARHGRSAMLIAEDLRYNKRGKIKAHNGRRRSKDGVLSGSFSAVIFNLVPQVTLPKRLNLDTAVNSVANQLPVNLVSRWR